MSAVIGVNRTKALDPSPANILAPGTFEAKVRSFVDTYEASSLASGSTIAMGPNLPAGAIILGMELATDDLGASVVLSVGDSDTAARYMSAVDAHTAKAENKTLVDGLGYTVGTATGDNKILITTGGATATGTIKLVGRYATAA